MADRTAPRISDDEVRRVIEAKVATAVNIGQHRVTICDFALDLRDTRARLALVEADNARLREALTEQGGAWLYLLADQARNGLRYDQLQPWWSPDTERDVHPLADPEIRRGVCSFMAFLKGFAEEKREAARAALVEDETDQGAGQ